MNGKREFEDGGGPAYWSTLARGKRTIATSVAIFAALGLIIDLVTPSVYRATARIEMRRPAERAAWVGQPMSTGNFQSENVALSTDAELITNRGLLTQLVAEINTPGTRLAEASRGHERGFGPAAFRWLGGAGPSASTAAAASTSPGDPTFTNAQVEWLARNVRVEPVKDTRLVDIHVEDTSPQFARTLADRLCQLFISYQARRALEADTTGMATLASRLGVQPGTDVVDAGTDPRLHSIALVTAQRDRARQSITGLNEAIVRTRATRIAVEAQLARARHSSIEPMNDPGLQVLDMSNTTSLRRSLLDTQVQLAAARKVYREGHPKMIALRSDSVALQARIKDESRHSLAALRAQASTLAAEEASLSGALAKAEGRLGAVVTDEQGRTFDERQRIEDETLYEQMVSRLRGAQSSNPAATPAVALVDPAALEPKPVRPHRLINLVTCMAAGVLAGAGLVLARAGGRTMLRGAEDAETQLGLPVLAEVGRQG